MGRADSSSICLTYQAEVQHRLIESNRSITVSLKTILIDKYLTALKTGQPQETMLEHGLGIHITVVEGKCTLQLIRYWSQYPSAVEVRTVLDHWPYPVKAHSQSKREEGRRRIIEIPLPVQEVLPS